MFTLPRAILLGMGMRIGRMVYGFLSFFMGCVVLETVWMCLTGHWILGTLVFLGGNWIYSWLWARLTEEH